MLGKFCDCFLLKCNLTSLAAAWVGVTDAKLDLTFLSSRRVSYLNGNQNSHYIHRSRGGGGVEMDVLPSIKGKEHFGDGKQCKQDIVLFVKIDERYQCIVKTLQMEMGQQLVER